MYYDPDHFRQSEGWAGAPRLMSKLTQAGLGINLPRALQLFKDENLHSPSSAQVERPFKIDDEKPSSKSWGKSLKNLQLFKDENSQWCTVLIWSWTQSSQPVKGISLPIILPLLEDMNLQSPRIPTKSISSSIWHGSFHLLDEYSHGIYRVGVMAISF